MRVIKHGSLNPNDRFVTTCPYCKCEYEYTRSEAIIHWNTLCTKCPDCNGIVHADKKNTPNLH